MLQKRIRFGIPSFYYIFAKFTAKDYFRNNNLQENRKQNRRTWMILDMLYFSLLAEKRISITIFKEKECYMMKTEEKMLQKIREMKIS